MGGTNDIDESQFYRLTHDYIAQTPEQLSCKKGDIVMLLQEKDNGWGEAVLVDETGSVTQGGWLPVSHMSPLDSVTSHTRGASMRRSQAQRKKKAPSSPSSEADGTIRRDSTMWDEQSPLHTDGGGVVAGARGGSELGEGVGVKARVS